MSMHSTSNNNHNKTTTNFLKRRTSSTQDWSLNNLIPVVYVFYGNHIPMYLKINIEVASRKNPVIIITDISSNPAGSRTESSHSALRKVLFEDINKYSVLARDYEPYYRHLCPNHNHQRKMYEMQCIQRWFVLKEFMEGNNIPVAFFGDGDVAVFVNVTDAYELRSKCDSIINIEHQAHDYHWVGAGETSFWTIPAITDFTIFTMSMYKDHLKTLEMKFKNHRSAVVDMSILWLWWVGHHRNDVDWDTGRPFKPNGHVIDSQECFRDRAIYDRAFQFAKSLEIAPVNNSLRVCNGMDVVNRSAFDHMHGWKTGRDFSFNIETDGIPSTTNCCMDGGKPEINVIQAYLQKHHNIVSSFDNSKLRINAIHYQGDSKERIGKELCELLRVTSDKHIIDQDVVKTCVI
eukprot:gene6355-8754_t